MGHVSNAPFMVGFTTENLVIALVLNQLHLDHDGKVLELKSIEYNAGLCEKDGKI